VVVDALSRLKAAIKATNDVVEEEQRARAALGLKYRECTRETTALARALAARLPAHGPSYTVSDGQGDGPGRAHGESLPFGAVQWLIRWLRLAIAEGRLRGLCVEYRHQPGASMSCDVDAAVCAGWVDRAAWLLDAGEGAVAGNAIAIREMVFSPETLSPEERPGGEGGDESRGQSSVFSFDVLGTSGSDIGQEAVARGAMQTQGGNSTGATARSLGAMSDSARRGPHGDATTLQGTPSQRPHSLRPSRGLSSTVDSSDVNFRDDTTAPGIDRTSFDAGREASGGRVSSARAIGEGAESHGIRVGGREMAPRPLLSTRIAVPLRDGRAASSSGGEAGLAVSGGALAGTSSTIRGHRGETGRRSLSVDVRRVADTDASRIDVAPADLAMLDAEVDASVARQQRSATELMSTRGPMPGVHLPSKTRSRKPTAEAPLVAAEARNGYIGVEEAAVSEMPSLERVIIPHVPLSAQVALAELIAKAVPLLPPGLVTAALPTPSDGSMSDEPSHANAEGNASVQGEVSMLQELFAVLADASEESVWLEHSIVCSELIARAWAKPMSLNGADKSEEELHLSGLRGHFGGGMGMIELIEEEDAIPIETIPLPGEIPGPSSHTLQHPASTSPRASLLSQMTRLLRHPGPLAASLTAPAAWASVSDGGPLAEQAARARITEEIVCALRSVMEVEREEREATVCLGKVAADAVNVEKGFDRVAISRGDTGQQGGKSNIAVDSAGMSDLNSKPALVVDEDVKDDVYLRTAAGARAEHPQANQSGSVAQDIGAAHVGAARTVAEANGNDNAVRKTCTDLHGEDLDRVESTSPGDENRAATERPALQRWFMASRCRVAAAEQLVGDPSRCGCCRHPCCRRQRSQLGSVANAEVGFQRQDR